MGSFNVVAVATPLVSSNPDISVGDNARQKQQPLKAKRVSDLKNVSSKGQTEERRIVHVLVGGGGQIPGTHKE